MLQPLWEDNHLLVLNKPAGLATMGSGAGEMSLWELARADLKRRYAKPGNVYLGVVSRLDAVTSGVIVLAKTSKAAARLARQFRERQVEKTYRAAVTGQLLPQEGRLEDHVCKDESRQRMMMCDPHRRGAQRAVLQYRELGRHRYGALLEISLETGRKHQIRVQLGERRHPVVGDRKYGSQQSFPQGIALHAYRLKLMHPVRRTPLELVAPLPEAWSQLGATEF